MKVDIGGQEIDLPDDQAKAVIAFRDKERASRREVEGKASEIEKRLAAIEKERNEAAEKAAAALREKEAVEAMKAGDLEKVKQALTAEHKKALDGVSSELERLRADKARGELRATVAASKEVLPEAVDLVTKLLAADYRITAGADGKTIIATADGRSAVGPDGNPLTLDGVVGQFLASNAAAVFRKSKVGAGSGTAGSGSANGALHRGKMSVAEKAAYVRAHGQQAFLALPA